MSFTPTRVELFIRRLTTSTCCCHVETDCGNAYVKTLGNKEGPHCLAADWIGTHMAKAMGLPTFEVAILRLGPDEVPFDTSGAEEPGPAFAAREVIGGAWDGTAKSLEGLTNHDDIAKLIVLDTWLRNWDRKSPSGDRINRDNVFLRDGETLIAMDFSHCIGRAGTLHGHVADLGAIRDVGIYSAFDEFLPYVTGESVRRALESLGKVTDTYIDEVVGSIPTEWEVESEVKKAVRTFLMERRDYIVGNFVVNATASIGPQLNLENE